MSTLDADVAAAAARWPLQVQSLSLAAHRENAVYRLVAQDGRSYALRQHRPGYRSGAELSSELAFMAGVAGLGIAVPQPLAGHDGAHMQVVGGVQYSVLTWMTGAPLVLANVSDATARTAFFRRFGAAIAALHDAADRWVPPAGFVRQAWGLDGLLGEAPQWGRFWDNTELTAPQRRTLLAVRDRLRQRLHDMPPDQGLIHADLVRENVLVDGERLVFIDFDDSGPGYRLQDLATALVKHEAEPDFAALKAALVEGYGVRGAVTVEQVDLFLLIRHLSYLGWIVPRMTKDEGMTRCHRFIANVMPMAEAFLA